VTSIGVRFTRASCSSATEVANSAIGSWRAARCGTPATTDGDAEPFGLTFRRCDGRGAVRTAPAGAGAGAVGGCAAAGRRGGASASPSHDESVMWMSRWTSPSQSLPIDATKRGHRTTHLGMRVDVRVRAPGGGCAAGWRGRLARAQCVRLAPLRSLCCLHRVLGQRSTARRRCRCRCLMSRQPRGSRRNGLAHQRVVHLARERRGAGARLRAVAAATHSGDVDATEEAKAT
jgi:hypothetical protein